MGIGGMKRVKGSSTGKDREDREQVNSPKQCPVRLRTKAHREKRGERRGRSRAWDGWGGQSRGRLGHREGCGRTAPRSESRRGGTERLGQAPRRPSHAGAAVTGEGRGGREGAGSPAVVGELLRGRDGHSRPPRSGPARGSEAGSTSGPGSHRRRPRAPGPAAPPGEERRAGGPGPTAPSPGPRGVTQCRAPRRRLRVLPGRAGPGQASLRHNAAASLHSPASRVPQSQGHVRPPLPPPPGPDPPPPPPPGAARGSRRRRPSQPPRPGSRRAGNRGCGCPRRQGPVGLGLGLGLRRSPPARMSRSAGEAGPPPSPWPARGVGAPTPPQVSPVPEELKDELKDLGVTIDEKLNVSRQVPQLERCVQF
nr:translation initiation factor IF-2-like [Taeniopygia guttata]